MLGTEREVFISEIFWSSTPPTTCLHVIQFFSIITFSITQLSSHTHVTASHTENIKAMCHSCSKKMKNEKWKCRWMCIASAGNNPKRTSMYAWPRRVNLLGTQPWSMTFLVFPNKWRRYEAAASVRASGAASEQCPGRQTRHTYWQKHHSLVELCTRIESE